MFAKKNNQRATKVAILSMQNATISMFAQIVQLLGKRIDFQQLVNKHGADKGAKGLTTWSQFIAMLFCQLTGADSLREIADGLYSCIGKLQHLGASPVVRSTLSYANAHRPYIVYKEFYFCLLEKFRHEFQGRLGKRFQNPVYSLDSTTISLCLRLFEWAHHRRRKGGIKLHTLLNNDTGLPEVIDETNAKCSDIKAARGMFNLPAGSIVVMDRGYNDYALYNELTQKQITFVTRLKETAVHTPLNQKKIAEDPDLQWGLYEMHFTGTNAKKVCGDTPFRVLQWYDKVNDRWFEFLTNNLELSAQEIADLYRERWQIELFFKKIKQNLIVKTFVGTSKNAVLTQIWTAAIAVLLLELLKRRSKYDWSFSRLRSYLRLNLMTCKDLTIWLDQPDIQEWEEPPRPFQGTLF